MYVHTPAFVLRQAKVSYDHLNAVARFAVVALSASLALLSMLALGDWDTVRYMAPVVLMFAVLALGVFPGEERVIARRDAARELP